MLGNYYLWLVTIFFSKKYAVKKWSYPGVKLEENSVKETICGVAHH